MVLEWTRPGLSSPLRPICDLRVLDHFIKEAWDAEAALRACKDACSIATNFTVPLTRVDFDVWEAMNVSFPQAQEVQSGIHVLNEAISSLQASNQTDVLQSHIDASINNIASIRQVLRSLSIPLQEQENGCYANQGVMLIKRSILQTYVNFRKRTCLSLNGDCIILA
uniref:Erythropoietin n=1 Tax=Cyprinus carpio TaxID=7962 RepID=A0A8C1LSE6_CYPCA